MLTWIERAHKPLLPVLIFHEAFALALRDDEEVVVFFTLLNLDLLWLTHHQFNLCYHIVFHVGVQGENQVLLKLLREDKSGHFFLEAGADHFEKFTQLVLMIERLLDVLQVRDDSILDLLR